MSKNEDEDEDEEAPLRLWLVSSQTQGRDGTKGKRARNERNQKKRRAKLDDFTKGRIIQCLELDVPISEIAKRVKIDRKTVRNWKKRYSETGTCERKRRTRCYRKLSQKERSLNL